MHGSAFVASAIRVRDKLAWRTCPKRGACPATPNRSRENCGGGGIDSSTDGATWFHTTFYGTEICRHSQDRKDELMNVNKHTTTHYQTTIRWAYKVGHSQCKGKVETGIKGQLPVKLDVPIILTFGFYQVYVLTSAAAKSCRHKWNHIMRTGSKCNVRR